MRTDQLGADRMKGADPWQVDPRARARTRELRSERRPHTALDLISGLTRERDGANADGVDTIRDKVADALGEHLGLAAASTSDDGDRARDGLAGAGHAVLDGLALLTVQMIGPGLSLFAHGSLPFRWMWV